MKKISRSVLKINVKADRPDQTTAGLGICWWPGQAVAGQAAGPRSKGCSSSEEEEVGRTGGEKSRKRAAGSDAGRRSRPSLLRRAQFLLT